MRKLQKAAVVMAMLGSVSFLGAGISHAGDEPSAELNNKQTNACSQKNTTQGLINIDDLNLALVNAAALAASSADLARRVGCERRGWGAALALYAGWCTFAMALTGAISRRNPEA